MIDNKWENIYKNNKNTMNSFTYPIIATLIQGYIARHSEKNIEDIIVLELGFGSGANLLYLAELGCKVYGIDISETAVKYAENLFYSKEQKGTFSVSSFAPLKFEDNFFDIVIDRGALVCASKDLFNKTIKESYRVLKPNGELLLTPYSELNHNTLAVNSIRDSVEIKTTPPHLSMEFHTYNINEILKILNQNQFHTFFIRRNDRIDYIFNENIISGEKVISNYDIISKK